MFAFLISSHRKPAIDCCECPLIFSWALHYLTFVLNATRQMTCVCVSVMSDTSVCLFVFNVCACPCGCVSAYLCVHALNENRSGYS